MVDLPEPEPPTSAVILPFKPRRLVSEVGSQTDQLRNCSPAVQVLYNFNGRYRMFHFLIGMPSILTTPPTGS
jgi:hypothetical protein